MTELIYFFGRFHVLVLHLPIGILLLAVLAEILSRRERYRAFQPAVGFIWLAGALSAVVTVVLGYMHASEGGFEGAALDGHRLAGTSLAVVAAMIWVARSRFDGAYAKLWPLGIVLVVGLLFVTGHFGGNLTHGETYLVEYAPVPLQRMVGTVARSKPRDLASADLYLDVVAPALEQRCASCHNDGKRKGGLMVTEHAALMKGGENGAVIVAGQPERSDLYRRITLPHDDEAFMPKDGKTPLTPEQVSAIGWWISVGAPEQGLISKLDPPADVRVALESTWGFAASGVHGAESHVASGAHGSGAKKIDVAPASAQDISQLEASGFVVRSISMDSPLVQVDYTANRAITNQDIELLAKIGPQIRSLNLREAGVTDAHLASIGKFEHLEILRLELNPITDAGLTALAGLENLTYLNLYGTKISDKGVATLSKLGKLDHLFLWQTSVTQAGITQLKREHADLMIDGGFDPSRFPVGPKVIPVVN